MVLKVLISLLLICELNLNNLEASIKAINYSLERNPCPEAQKLKGKILYLSDQHEQALQEFKQLLASNPEDIYLMQCTAICMHKTGDIDSALNLYEQILQLDCDNQIAYDNVKAIHNSKEEKLAEQEEVSDSISVLEQADRHYKNGDLEGAIKEIENALNSTEQNSALYATLGSLEYQSGLLEKSVIHLRKAVEIDAHSADFLTRLALAEHKSGNVTSFIKYINRALDEDSKYIPALINQMYTYLSVQSVLFFQQQ